MNQISKLIRKTFIPVMGIVFSLMLFSTKTFAGSYSSCGMHAHFTYTVSGDTVRFTDSSYTTSTTYNKTTWNFGDGTKSTTTSPTHIYSSSGKYAVTHYVFDSTNTKCVGYETDTITILASAKSCTAGFSYSVAGKKVTFTNTSSTSGKLYCSWKFGDGNKDTSKNPSHTYSSTASSEKVTLYISNGAGCYDSITQTITLGACGMNCKFTYKVSGFTVNFTDSSYSTGTPYTNITWSFGDSTSSTTKSPSHTYKHTGKFIIVHYIYDSISKCFAHQFDTVIISGKTTTCGIHAKFTYSVSGYDVTFTDSSSTTHQPITNYYWSFGDKSTNSTSKNPKHTYAAAGKYAVLLYIWDSVSHCTSTIIDTVTITAPAPCGIHCYYTYSVSGKAVTFTDSSWTTGSKIARYYWSFGDTTSATTQNASHTYKHNGKFAVVHYAIDSNNKCYVRYVDSVIIGTVTTKCGMHAYFSDSISGYTVYFKNPSYSTGNAITNYYWSYGDGTTSSGKDHYHTYSASGKYKVLLYVWDSVSHCSASYTDSITISTTTKKCGMHAYFNDSVSGKTVYFANSSYSTGNAITNYYWSYGDGSTSTGKDYHHTYSASGKYKVLLYVWDSVSHCSSSYTDSITIGSSTTTTKTYDLIGYVYMKGVGMADYATVYLINYKFSDSTLNLIDSFNMTPSDSGKYHFGGLAPGNYLVKGALTSSSSYYKKYVPTYFHSSMHWDSATYVKIVSSTGYAGIFMIAGSNPGGAGFIGGKVTAGANKVGDPIANIEIQLYDASNNLIAYTYSDINGAYGFSNLAYGSYTVYPEVLGKQTTTATVSVDGSTPSLGNVGITVDTKTVTASVTGIETNSEQFFSAVIYPNPVSDALNIEFNNLVNASTTLAVFDATGRMVLSRNIALTTGKQQVRINTDKFPSGFYLIKISDNNGRFESQYRFIKSN